MEFAPSTCFSEGGNGHTQGAQRSEFLKTCARASAASLRCRNTTIKGYGRLCTEESGGDLCIGHNASGQWDLSELLKLITRAGLWLARARLN